ncbi:shikimate dehydrogenase family protein [Acinetobacter sp. TUM15512]|uniref:shikimate dehydrogenase family protein n=1 Tax=Acinetobacter sp. TUM15512 TaxID=2609155 RepID=UPI00125E9D0C|nr:shikimate dehydrogenase [Acinetobacter sp. TUM15512]
MININGKTKLIVLIGDPIEKAKTPELMNQLLANRGLLGEYIAIGFHISPEHLKDAIDGIKKIHNFVGAVVTMPYKQQIISLIDSYESDVKFIEACNLIYRQPDASLHGYNFDGVGFVAGLKSNGYVLKNKRCVLMGAGGAASAIAYALLAEECLELNILNRSHERAEKLKHHLQAKFKNIKIKINEKVVEHFDLLINATPLGMNEADPLPTTEDIIKKAKMVAECVVTVEKTKLLTLAEQHTQIHFGKAMLEGQLSLMLELFMQKRC